MGGTGKLVFYIDLVPARGRWVRLENDSKKITWLCILGEPRVIVWSMNAAWKELNTSIKHLDHTYVKNSLFDTNQIISAKYTHQNITNKVKLKRFKLERILCESSGQVVDYTPIRVQLKLIKRFADPRFYQLGKPGRKRINARFRQTLPISIRTLTSLDLIRSINELDQLIEQFAAKRFDDLDNLGMLAFYGITHHWSLSLNTILNRFRYIIQINPSGETKLSQKIKKRN